MFPYILFYQKMEDDDENQESIKSIFGLDVDKQPNSLYDFIFDLDEFSQNQIDGLKKYDQELQELKLKNEKKMKA